MILITILRPIFAILTRLFFGVTEDVVTAKSKYYDGSGLDRAWKDTKGQRDHIKYMTKGFIKGITTPVKRD